MILCVSPEVFTHCVCTNRGIHLKLVFCPMFSYLKTISLRIISTLLRAFISLLLYYQSSNRTRALYIPSDPVMYVTVIWRSSATWMLIWITTLVHLFCCCQSAINLQQYKLRNEWKRPGRQMTMDWGCCAANVTRVQVNERDQLQVCARAPSWLGFSALGFYSCAHGMNPTILNLKCE